MKNIIVVILSIVSLILTMPAFSFAGDKAICDLKEGYWSEKTIHSITTVIEPNYEIVLAPTEFTVNGLRFNGSVKDGQVRAELIVGGNIITASYGTESSLYYKPQDQHPLRLECRVH